MLMKINSKIAIIIFSLTLLFFEPTWLVYAEGTEQLELPKITISPGSLYYSFKRLLEKGYQRIIFSKESKISFLISLLKTRLSELNLVVNKKDLSEVQGSSERFAYQAGILTEELLKQNNFNDKGKVIKEFENYSRFLSTLRDKYQANSSFWMLIQHDINTLSILSDRLK